MTFTDQRGNKIKANLSGWNWAAIIGLLITVSGFNLGMVINWVGQKNTTDALQDERIKSIEEDKSTIKDDVRVIKQDVKEIGSKIDRLAGRLENR